MARRRTAAAVQVAGEFLHRFTDNTGTNADGGTPFPDRVLLDSAGNVYGTTSAGGNADGGIVFKIAP